MLTYHDAKGSMPCIKILRAIGTKCGTIASTTCVECHEGFAWKAASAMHIHTCKPNMNDYSGIKGQSNASKSAMHIRTCKPNMNACIPEQYFALLRTHIPVYYFCNVVSLQHSHIFYTKTCGTRHHSTTVV